MNKLIILVILMLIMSFQLLAEPVLLPDLEITGNSSIRSFLYKKHVLPDSTFIINDSLSTFIPNVGWITEAEPKVQELVRNGVVSASVNSSNQIYLDASLYNTGSLTELIKYNMQFEYPELDQVFFDNHLYIELPNNSVITDRFSTTYHVSKLDAHRLQYYALDFYLRTSEFPFKSFSYANLQTTLGLSYFSQNNIIDQKNSFAPRFKHKGRITNDAFEIDNTLLFTDMNPGLYADIYAFELFKYPILDITHWGMMMDSQRILPTIRFNYEYIPDYNKSLQISNTPTLVINDKEDLARKYRWYAFVSNPRYIKKPLNLEIEYSVLTAKPLLGLWDRFVVFAYSSMAYDIALPLTSYNNTVPLIGFNDQFSNSVGLNAGYIQLGGMKISQEIRTNLSYVTNRDMIRAPYTPLFQFDTELTGKYHSISYKANLTQEYDILDHNQKHINEVVDISFAAQYNIAKSTTIQASLRNLLNTKNYVFKGLPAEGIRLEFGINHIF
ncbi:MAG: hypothetical protein CVU48_08480 [Candidatus Cloacimonetes bacterium HGW-Cloacimonetes-1]|jgi:hypothetical protein|nr:MAG: hypothetical protein CVU48_08480 [Candidatus Cloacimonetes bacterium HGW-Cloacimonetes-1]